MLKLMNRLFGTALILMDNAGGGSGAGGGTDSLLTTPGGGSGSSAGTGNGGTGDPPNTGGDGAGGTSGDNPAGGTPPTDWRSALPKEFQENASLKRYKSVSDLAGAYVNAEKLISGDKMAVPNKNWTDSDWKNFYQKAGLPAELDKYEVKFKEGVDVDPDFSKSFKENAHKFGVLPKQAQGLADWFSDVTKQSEDKFLQTRKQEFEAQVGALKQEWGNAFDLNIARANKLIQDSGAHEHFKKMGYGSDPILMKHLAKIAAEKYTDPKVFESGSGGAGVRTPAEIDAEIGRLQVDDAYNSKNHPGHGTAVAQMSALHQEKFQAKKS